MTRARRTLDGWRDAACEVVAPAIGQSKSAMAVGIELKLPTGSDSVTSKVSDVISRLYFGKFDD